MDDVEPFLNYGQPYQSKRKKPDDSHVECTPNRWKYGGLMVSQGAKVWVNEYSMKSSKKELSEVRLLPIRRR